jgi:hypothetical protein
LEYNGEIWGAAAFGPPRHNNYSKGGEYRIIDLRRLACRDEAPKFTESYFLGKMLRYLKKHNIADAVLTYADETQGHKGTIYKAANFEYIGTTAPSKHIVWKGKQYHMRSLTIDRPYSYILRDAIKSGDALIVNGLPKHIYIYWLVNHE